MNARQSPSADDCAREAFFLAQFGKFAYDGEMGSTELRAKAGLARLWRF